MPLDAHAQEDDATLLAQYAAGQARAARILTARLTPVVYAHAFRLLGDRAEAEDVTQEALMRLWKIAPDWDAGRAKVTTWLYRVTHNLAMDRLRRRQSAPQDLDALAAPADPGPGAEAQLQAQARLRALRLALADLPERQRMAMMLRHLEGLGNPEIATRLDVSVEAVESLVARGKRALTSKLLEQKDALGFTDD